MKHKYTVGIDPGVNGGIAGFYQDGSVALVQKMPTTDADVFTLLKMFAGSSVWIERVHSSPQMGVVSAFTFGRGVGRLHMACAALACPLTEVSPTVWQSAMGCLSRGDKNVTKRRAQQLWPPPGFAITHAFADAMLIAEYGRRFGLVHGIVSQKGKASHGENQENQGSQDRAVTQAQPR